MGFISKVNVDGTTHLVASSAYGVCNTSPAVAAKEVVMSDFNALIPGVTIHVYFAFGNTATAPTLNVNSTGAKTILLAGQAAPTGTLSWVVRSIVSFTYTTDHPSVPEGCWLMNDSKDTTYDTMTQA